VATRTDASELIRENDVDAVVVATPTPSHYALCKEALEAGKHVLCEKPLTMRSSEAEELVNIAERSGLVLMVGHVFMYNPGIVYLKERIEKGVFGRIYYLDAVRTNLGPIRRDVGAIYDLASHEISIFNFLLMDTPLEVSALGQQFIQGDREDVAFLTLRYPGQTVCHAHVSWLNPRKVRQLTVVGDEKMAVWDDMRPLEPIRIYDKGLEQDRYYESFGQFQMTLREADITIPKVDMFEPLAQQAQEFARCVREGSQPISNGLYGVGVVRVLEAAMESLWGHGRQVVLREG
jgi:predicted dehydrogenase